MNGLIHFAIQRRESPSMLGWPVRALEISAIINPWAVAFLNCASNSVPGLRVYFGLQGAHIVILLGGGDKSTQARDISRAQKLCKVFKSL
jgi:hypothetical protein